jgi:NitT/TauT family transport system ATP-binding protein
MSASSSIDLRSVCFRFGEREILKDLSLEVRQGEFVSLAGPSGCGKSTLLNIIAGAIQPASGQVRVTGRFRTIFQHGGLFPWMTVGENLDLALRSTPDRAARRAKRDELLQRMGLLPFAGLYPHQLSGGMRQKVEIARAIADDTEILLLDEPFAALDYLTRVRIRGELARFLQTWPRTVLLVTHDIEEAVQLSDRVVLLAYQPARKVMEMEPGLPRPCDPLHPGISEAVRQILGKMSAGAEDFLPSLVEPKPVSALTGGVT